MAGRSYSVARDEARRNRRIEFFLSLAEAAACVALVWVFLLALFFGPDNVQAAPLDATPGMTCTYTPPARPSPASPSRTYEVEVVSTFEASYERDGRPWLWVKRPSEARYQSVIVSPATLSGCQR